MVNRGTGLRLRLTPNIYRTHVVFKIVFENITELCVGGGSIEQATSPADIPVAKMWTEVTNHDKMVLVPYIPGSTLRGAIRSLIMEYLVEDQILCDSERYTVQDILDIIIRREVEMDVNEIRDLCDKLVLRVLYQIIDEELSNKIVAKLRDKLIQHLRQEQSQSLEDIVRSSIEETDIDIDADYLTRLILDAFSSYRIFVGERGYYISCDPIIEGLACELPIPGWKLKILNKLNVTTYPCKICRIFGLPGYESKTIVTDAWPNDLERILILKRTHIAIDRIRGTVAHGKTFDMEYIVPGAQFEAYIIYNTFLRPEEAEEVIEKAKKMDLRDLDCLEIEETDNPWEIEKQNLTILTTTLRKIAEDTQEEGPVLQLGRRKSTGMGICKIIELKYGIPNKTTTSTPSNKRIPKPLQNLRNTLKIDKLESLLGDPP